ncbi:MAG TPA: RsmE family RNA methyltransferase [Kiritimatiellia bacterium]|nr:RsmE family RNA methyltransferase [Kiritimatiellia bacterium]HRU71183.1 RsmE family RNA methyltransferase [Kiritimatiellia bacterium]
MNRILFEADEFLADGTVLLTDVRAEHLRRVLHVEPGQTVASGTLNGLAGVSRVLSIGEEGVRLCPVHDVALPEPWIDLLLALPRPKVLKRLWPQLAALGVGRIVLLNAAKVEKCYFSSQWLEPRAYRPLLIEGLMQAGLTRLPEVLVAPRFKPFVEDELGRLFPETVRLLAHPGTPTALPSCDPAHRARPLLAVGPEGGWTDYEIEQLRARGFRLFSMGGRILRSDTACIALIAVLEYVLAHDLNVAR